MRFRSERSCQSRPLVSGDLTAEVGVVGEVAPNLEGEQGIGGSRRGRARCRSSATARSSPILLSTVSRMLDEPSYGSSPSPSMDPRASHRCRPRNRRRTAYPDEPAMGFSPMKKLSMCQPSAADSAVRVDEEADPHLALAAPRGEVEAALRPTRSDCRWRRKALSIRRRRWTRSRTSPQWPAKS